MFEKDKHGNFESSFQGVQITIVHGIFLLLLTLDLWGLTSSLLSYLPSIASPSSPPPLSVEQPLLPGERWHLLERWGTGPGHEQCRCWGVVCTDSRWRWAAPPTPACQLICTGDPPCSRRRFELVGGDLCCSRPRPLPRGTAGLQNLGALQPVHQSHLVPCLSPAGPTSQGGGDMSRAGEKYISWITDHGSDFACKRLLLFKQWPGKMKIKTYCIW